MTHNDVINNDVTENDVIDSWMNMHTLLASRPNVIALGVNGACFSLTVSLCIGYIGNDGPSFTQFEMRDKNKTKTLNRKFN